MATRRKSGKQRHGKEPRRRGEIADEELPIDAKKLREMLLKRGFDPEGNEFSQGIVATREE